MPYLGGGVGGLVLPLWRAIRTAWGNEFNMHPPIQQLSPCLCLREIPKGTGRGRDMAESSAAWAAGGKAGLHPWGIKKQNEEEPPAAVRGGTPDDPRVCAQISVLGRKMGGLEMEQVLGHDCMLVH